MFRSIVYLDKEKMYSYLRQIDKEYSSLPKEIKTRKNKGGSFGFTNNSFHVGAETEVVQKM